MPRHSHDLNCLEEVSGKIICRHEAAAGTSTSERSSRGVPSSTAADLISYQDPGHSVRNTQLVHRKATIYMRGEFMDNIHKVEVTQLAILIGKYAQYDGAIGVYFVPRGKRNIRLKIETSNPTYLLVLDGWGHPDPSSPYVTTQKTPGAIVSTGRYFAHDPRFKTDFDRSIGPYLHRAHVLADLRGSNPYVRATGAISGSSA